MNCTGWMFHNASPLNCAWRCIKCLHGLAPQYLSQRCMPVSRTYSWSPPTTLCTPMTTFLITTQQTTTGVPFVYGGRHPWNLLSESIRKSTPVTIFKRSLKTFLFQQSMHSAHFRRFISRLMSYTSVLSILIPIITSYFIG